VRPNEDVGNNNVCRWIRGVSQQAEDAPDLPAVDSVTKRGTDFSLANMADRFVAVTGGGGSNEPNRISLSDAFRFDISGNKWEKLPNMNIARHAHASSSIDGNLYVFCGYHMSMQNEDIINTIEVLDDACSALDLIASWRIINLSPSVLPPRFFPAAAPINDD